MKPCSKNRKLIAWLVLGALDARQVQALRDHLAHCEGCRRYWEEISNVTERLTAVKPNLDIQASEFFHQRVAEKLQTVESSSVLENLTAFIRETMLNWRVALPATMALAIVVFALVALRQHPAVSLPVPQIASASGSESDLAPTLANYQMVANQSLEKLDELLTRQGNKCLPPAPIYTASTFRLANMSF